MKVLKATAIFFSPTDTTKGVISEIVERLPISTTMVDITCHADSIANIEFTNSELVIFGIPVYGGRVPTPVVEKIRNMVGQQTPAVLIVTYGNREYDDALLELKDIVEKNGFIVIAAAAFVTEHSIMHSVAHGRPDDRDRKAIYNFADNLWGKIQNIGNVTDVAINVPGNKPYKEYGGTPFKPQATDDCTKCGICADNCPVNAIPFDDPSKIDETVCISCLRCIKVCPYQARKLDENMLSRFEQAFAKQFSARREPEIFI